MEAEQRTVAVAWVDFQLGLVLGEQEATLDDAVFEPPTEVVARVDEL